MKSLISERICDPGTYYDLLSSGPSTLFPLQIDSTCRSFVHFSSLQPKCKSP
jgi:hypothetical protein